MPLTSTINCLRVFAITLFVVPIFLFNKEKAIFIFLNFAGPTFIKLGQLLSTREDLIGKKIAKKLTIFQDKLEPLNPRIIKRILNKEFGNDFTKIFIDFQYNETASASIAQVHKAKLNNDIEVAVKILRPNIRTIMERDIKTLELITKITFPFSKFLHKTLSEILTLLKETAKYELDLLLEGANASRLKEEMSGSSGFYVPQIFWQYSTSQILISEWIDGVKINDTESMSKLGLNQKKIAENLVLNYFKQVYENGFFHADMHPGNLFVMKNGNIAVVDFGIMGVIEKKTRIAIAKILIGFLEKNYYEIAKIHIEEGLVPQETNVDELSLSCRKIGEMIVGNNVKDISITKLLTALIEMSRQYKLNSKPELLLLQKTLLLVEGVGMKLDPDLNIWNLARPWVKEWAKTNISFDAKIRDFIFDIYKKFKTIIKN